MIGFTSGYTPGEGGGFAGLEERYVEIAVESGETLWQRSFRSELIDDACPQSGFVTGLGNGVMSPTRVLAFFRCRGLIAFFPGRESDSVKVIQSPTYTEEPPNERDVEDYVSGLESLPFRPLADREDAMAGREVDWYDVSAVRAWRR